MAKTLVTLNENRDFLWLYRRGKSFVHPVLVVYAMRNRNGVCRVGLTASKKVGKAVIRNRARRVMRAALQQLTPKISDGWTLVFVARARTPALKSTALVPVMEKLLRSAGAIRN